ncbi:hypothetical protein Pst134EA_025479 [Puccinia striiformis f. sp. tritici]|uniref:Uncharacterized protein n=1 Tax=Puccinia striiformis f. sp. tritici PST-78 TaxID=1165861 RepID=A0A0L0W0X6_9BASI|nr:hypothetical protein Pst134EA_025479 [Puccinia striiformis f. sp. tritici]KAH9443717.1 hypothetical protein Pst134EB_026114 [Puccinia striiformis f. sp. tritici]KAH9451529.1 hypothetical protein Pst134EA_025479 [Puccinia striiformis f. sp. tritici]KNF05117.1 hypothetical protein PSTG_01746 [Puccinia striiformis f. sp. tritici PST-78]
MPFTIPPHLSLPSHLPSPTMSIMNLFRRRFIIFALVALIIVLHSGQVAAVLVACTAHFAPLPFDPTGKTVGKASCISKADPKKDHYCTIGTCGVRHPTSYTHWSNLEFTNCDGRSTTVFVEQYFRYETYAAAQDRDNKKFYNCKFSAADQNREFISCDC